MELQLKKYLLDLMYTHTPLKLLPMLVSLRVDRMRKRIHSRRYMEQRALAEQKRKQRTTNTSQRSTKEWPIGIPDWLKKRLTTGKIKTPSGREFAFPDVVRKSSGRVSHFTQIKNYPVQSFATADIVPVALIHIDDLLSGMRSCIVNSVHDSIVIDVHPDEEEEGYQHNTPDK
ncbi:MAG: hypothetical protein CM15mV148_320 [uncultured marine virus]|nr:MAG: hypothetical protein CM15mV148_320 [uncultured marine virus]